MGGFHRQQKGKTLWIMRIKFGFISNMSRYSQKFNNFVEIQIQIATQFTNLLLRLKYVCVITMKIANASLA